MNHYYQPHGNEVDINMMDVDCNHEVTEDEAIEEFDSFFNVDPVTLKLNTVTPGSQL